MKRSIVTLLLISLFISLNACDDSSHTTAPNESSEVAAGTTIQQETTEGITIPDEFAEAVHLNIMSFNIYSRNSASMEVSNDEPADMRIQSRAPKLNEILLSEQIHIAGLQEVNPEWQSWLNDSLDSAFGYVGTHTSMTEEGGYIVYRKDTLTVVESGVFWLAEGAPNTSAVGWDGKYDRLCAWALFQVNTTGEYLLFMNTHLDHQGTLARSRGAKLILAQMQELLAQFEASYSAKTCPVILTGDMNAIPGSAAYRAFSSGLVDSFHAAAYNPIDENASTSPGLYHRVSEESYVTDGHRIDYIWVSSDNTHVASYNMLHTATNLCAYGEYISDHNAIIAEVLITN